MVTDLFENIRLVKMNALENLFLWQVLEKKEEELYWIKQSNWRLILSKVINTSGPQVFIASNFAIYLLLGNNLTLATAFTAISVFKIFRKNLKRFPYIL